MALPSLDFDFLDFNFDLFGGGTNETLLAEWQKDRSFGIVVDAGSSGTRLLVYSWKLEGGAPGQLPVITKAFPDWMAHRDSFASIAPGLSALAEAADGPSLAATAAYLAPLVEFAQAAVPAAKHAATPLFFLATAGMRLVGGDARDRLMRYACRAVRLGSAFDVGDDCDARFRIISGEDEGLYGWLAVNYLNAGFAPPARQTPPPPRPDSPPTFGFLDMGGASTQFAFEPVAAMKAAHRDVLRDVTLRTLDGKSVTYSVFVSTFLGFGVNEARRRYVEGLAGDAGLIGAKGKEPAVPGGAVRDPCLPNNLALKDDKYLSRVIASSSKASSNTRTTGIPDLVGTGSLQQCLAGLHPHLRKHAPCDKQPCLFDGVSAPISDFSKHRFIGVSEYYYTPTSVPGAVTHGGAYHFSEFAKNAELVCQGPYEMLKERYIDTHGPGSLEPGSVEENRLQLQCFKSAWVLEILHDGFGIPREHVLDKTTQHYKASPFEPANELNGFKISWTLGAMLLHVSSLIEPHDK
ncbi:nucleoside phosphatase GDA1/CD39 [Obelidium mucronatum]|nr:nucleoside phosphatase GDA1/CD39 [Obelidium mucronatum]